MSIIHLGLSDLEWLEIMNDLEDLQLYKTLVQNLRYREHLTSAKRALGLQHLAQSN